MTSRRRVAAGFAALLGLTGVLVFGGTLTASADAVISFGGATPAQGSTTAWTASAYPLEGTTTNLVDTVSLVDYSGSPVAIAGCEDLDASDGTWGCAATLTPGAKDIRVFQGTLPNTDTRTFTLTAPPVGTLQITAPEEGAVIDWSYAGIVVAGTTPSTLDPVAVYLDGEDLICVIDPATADWSCPAYDIPLGVHFVTAQQSGYPDASVSFEVAYPQAGIDSTSYSFVEGTPTAAFSGPSTYPGSDVTVALEIGDSVQRTCTDFDGGSGWSCTIPIADLAPDFYTAYVSQEVADGPSSFSFPVDVEITEVPPLSPPMTCSFTPGGFAVSSPFIVGGGLYPIAPYSGGGFSSGGSPEELYDQGSCNGDPGYQDASVTQWEFGPEIAGGSCGTGDCNASGLAPGLYDLTYTLSDGDDSAAGYGFSYEPFDYLFRIPETPTFGSVASTTNSVLVRGSGTPGDGLVVARPNGTTLCSTTITDDGIWACQFAKSSTSTARVLAVDPQSGGLSAYSATRAIPVFVRPVTPPVTPAIDPPLTLVNWFLEFTSGDLMNLKPGDTFTLSISGMPEGTEIEVWMHSTPVLLGTETGTGLPMKMTLTVPQGIENGQHEIEMIGVTPLGTQYFFTSEARVSGGTDPAPPLKDQTVLDDKTDVGPYDRSDPASPSALSDGLAPVSAIATNPATLAIAGGLALALLFLVALPTELLNSSLSSNTSRLGRAYGAVDGALTKAQDWFIKVTRSRAVAALILTTVIAIIYGFVDPNFGFDLVSLRLVLSLALAFFLLSFVASWISGVIIRRAWGAIGIIEMQPTIILFAVVGVIVARVLDFSPGFLVGIAIGLELLQASRTVSARAVFVQIGVVTGLALAAWVVYSMFTPGDDFAGMLVEDTMVALTAEGLTGALIALFPLKFLDGHDLWAVSKRLWVLAFVVVATAFSLLVLPTAIAGTDVADYGIWLLVFAVFGLVSLAVWLIFVRADAKAAAAESERVDA